MCQGGRQPKGSTATQPANDSVRVPTPPIHAFAAACVRPLARPRLPQRPVQAVWLLGQGLVRFRDASGTLGLLDCDGPQTFNRCGCAAPSRCTRARTVLPDPAPATAPPTPRHSAAHRMSPVTVHLQAADGSPYAVPQVQGKPGQSLMRSAVRAGVDGIAADCGGTLSCATCHVIVAADWAARLPPPSADEQAMLEMTAVAMEPTSRLACQITLQPELDGLCVRLPSTQY